MDTTLGNTVLHNIFAQNHSTSPFFDIALGRKDDIESDGTGMFLVGSHAPGFEAVGKAPVLPTPPDVQWVVPLDGVKLNGDPLPLGRSSIPSAPDGKHIVLLDTGTSVTFMPDAIVDAIYQSIPGSIKALGRWFSPCQGAANVSFVFGCVSYLFV